MKYRLFLDDYRNPLEVFDKTKNPIYKEEWVIVKTYVEYTNIIRSRGLPEYVSFDHDLEDEHYAIRTQEEWEIYHNREDHKPTGYDCALWLKKYCTFNNIDLPSYLIHSFSEVGSKKIRLLLG